jgi:hypothetical protein
MVEKTGDITRLLHQCRAGSRNAENELFALVLANIRRLAAEKRVSLKSKLSRANGARLTFDQSRSVLADA